MADATIEAEILAPGVHNGVTITHADLHEIASNFEKLREYVKPPLKLGHADNQVLAGQKDGQPALGWVRNLRVRGEKLVGEVGGIPQRVAELINAGRYRRQSAELHLDFAKTQWEKNLKTGVTGKVLTGLAVLGADLPAVSNLADFGRLLASDTGGDFTVEFDADYDGDGEGKRKCPHCGAECAMDAAACASCGKPMPKKMSITLAEDANPRTVSDERGNGRREQSKMDDKNPDVLKLQEQADKLAAELASEKAARETALAEQAKKFADESAARDAQIAALKADAERARERELALVAKRRDDEAAAFVDKYAKADCLKLANDESKVAARALYRLLLNAEEGGSVVKLSLSEGKPEADYTAAGLFSALMDSLPNAAPLLKPVANPRRGSDSTDFDTAMQEAAEKFKLNLSNADDRVKALEYVADKAGKNPGKFGFRPVVGE